MSRAGEAIRESANTRIGMLDSRAHFCYSLRRGFEDERIDAWNAGGLDNAVRGSVIIRLLANRHILAKETKNHTGCLAVHPRP